MAEKRKLRRYYWDSTCYIAILNAEPSAEQVLALTANDARDGKIEIVASTMCVTEVAYCKGEVAPCDRAVYEKKIRPFWDNEYIQMVSHSKYIAERGLDLVFRYGVKKLKPRDSIHLATAIYANCDVFETMDGRLLDLAEIDGFPIEIRKPRWEDQGTFDMAEEALEKDGI